MSKIKRSRWGNKSRVNTNQDLKTDGIKNQYALIPHQSRYDFKNTFSLSFFAEKGSGDGSYFYTLIGKHAGGSSDSTNPAISTKGWTVEYNSNGNVGLYFQLSDGITTNGSHRLFLPYDSKKRLYTITVSTTLITAYINGIYYNSIPNTTNGDYAVSNDIYIAAHPNFRDIHNAYGSFSLSHFSLFNKTLSVDEIKTIHSNGGILPKSTHLSCVGYWTLQDKEFTNNKFIDSVEQFNYAKEKATNFVTNGTFDNDLSGWIIDNSTENSWTWENGTAKYSSPLAFGAIRQVIGLRKTSQYRVKFTVINNNVGTVLLFLGGQGNYDAAIHIGNGTYDSIITSSTNAHQGEISIVSNSGPNQTFNIDNVEVYSMNPELTPNHGNLINYNSGGATTKIKLSDADKNFDSGNNWILGQEWDIADGKLRCWNSAPASTVCKLNVPELAGKVKITINVSSYTSGSIKTFVSSSAGDVPNINSVGTHIIYSEWSSGVTELRIRNAANTQLEIDSIDVESIDEPVNADYIADFYTREIISYSSILPELKKAVTLPPSSTPIILPNTINNGTDAWGMCFTVHLKEDFKNDGIKRMLSGNFDGGWFEFFKGRFLIISNNRYYLEVIIPNHTLKKGFLSFCFQINGRKLEAFINGVRTDVGHAGTGLVNELESQANPMYLRNMSGHRIYNDDGNMKVINYGLYSGNLSPKQVVELHNNTLLNNPTNINNWLCYYQFNQSGTTWKDLTGKCVDATTTATLTATDINTLR